MKSLAVLRPRVQRALANFAGRRTVAAEQPTDAASQARLLIARERLTEAVAVLEPVVQAKPDRAASLAPLLSELAGRGVSEAESMLHRVADNVPHDVLANHLVGERLLAAGQRTAALEHFQRVADVKSTSADDGLYQGIAFFRLGKVNKAEELLRRFLSIVPNHIDATAYLCQLLIALERFSDAVAVLEPVVQAAPDRAVSLVSLLVELSSRGITEAQALLRCVADSVPTDMWANFSVGKALLAADQHAVAAEYLRRVVDARPTAPDHWFYQGIALDHLGQTDEAEARLRQFLTLRPHHVDGTSLLIQVLIKSGHIAEPAALLASMIEVVPGRARDLIWMIFELWTKDPITSEPLLRRIAEGQAYNAQEMYDFARVAYAASMTQWACAFLTRARQLSDSGSLRVWQDLLLPFVPLGEEDLAYWVKRFESNLASLISSDLRLANPQELFVLAPDLIVLPPQVALFCYGINTRDLYPSIAKVWQTLCPELDWTAPHCMVPRVHAQTTRVRVGFLTQPNFPLLWGIAGELDRSQFEVVLLVLESSQSAQPTKWSSAVDRVVIVPDNSLQDARRAIANEAIDVLVHTPWTAWFYFLSHARLAPVQCVLCEPAWTDGVPNLDYYISWEAAEPARLQEHYVNSVALMTRPPYWLDRGYTREVALPREDFPLPVDAHWYVCPVNPLKFHVAFDSIIVRLLQADPQGIVVLLRGDSPLTRTVIRRLRVALGPAADRVHALPTLSEDKCHAFLKVADAVLDGWPIGGMSSSYAAIHAGIPTVTLPSGIVFGRWLAAFYEAIGVTDLIATDEVHYVELAVRLANDPRWRREIAARINERKAVLVEDRAAVRELESFFSAATAASRNGKRPRHWKAGRFIDPS